MSDRVDLLLVGSRPAERAESRWVLGDTLHADPTAAAVAGALSRIASTGSSGADEASSVLLWSDEEPLPAEPTLASLLREPIDLWHGGLRSGAAGQPRLLDFTRPTWAHTRDPDSDRVATSWRLHLGCCLVRRRALTTLGGPDPGFDTVLGSGLEMGHRYLRSGALVRYTPHLAPRESSTGESMMGESMTDADQVRFVRLRYGRRWAHWAILRAVASGHWRVSRARAAWVASGDISPKPDVHLAPGRVEETETETGARVTVLVPTLDRYEHLATLLNQLPRQTVAPHEVIVVDQTPPERRRELTADLPLRWLVREERGQCSSRNAGLQVSSGTHLLFLDDDDDELPADLIEAHLRNLESLRADASCGVVEEVGAGPPPAEFRHFRAADVLPTNNCMIRRSALVRSGLFDLAYEQGARADADLGMRLYLSGALAILDPEISLLHRRAPAGGLRTWGARRQTYASSRASLWRRHLPGRTELYLAMRYFSPAQVRERMWVAALGTLAGRGSVVRRSLRAAIGLLLMPSTLWTLRRRRREAEQLLSEYPQIPQLETES